MSFVSFDLILASTHTRSDDVDGDGLNSRLYIYPRYWNLYVLIFISCTHINARSEDTFCVCCFFFLGLKNFISPLFCWTVAKKKPPHIHQYLCE